MTKHKRRVPVFPIVLVLLLAALMALPFGLSGWLRLGPSAGPAKVAIEKYASPKNGSAYRLTVNGKPYLIKGACYGPIPPGKDYEYDFWNDPKKPWITDGKLMKQAGANTIRLYRLGKDPVATRRALEELYRKYGIRVLAGHYLGFWSWPPPNYADAAFQNKMRSEVLEMVKLYKDSPAILMWVLGNENNYSFDRNVQRWSNAAIDEMTDKEAQRKERARIYYSFINSLAKDIKAIDPNHPVVMGVGETASLDIAGGVAQDVDVIGMIAYRGPAFGNLFRQVQQRFDKPVVMIEWGSDSYNAMARRPDELIQAQFLTTQWQDIEKNADPSKGVGNSLGGTLFEWTDEWWKGNENLPHTWTIQDTASHWGNASYYFDADVPGGMNMNEEWWGVMAIDGNGRTPKKAYHALKQLWTDKKRI